LAKKQRVIEDMQKQLVEDEKIVKEAIEFVEKKNSSGKWSAAVPLKGNTFDKLVELAATIDKGDLLDDAYVLGRIKDAPLVKNLHLSLATDTGYPDPGLEKCLVDTMGGSISIVPTTLTYVRGSMTEVKDDGTKVEHEYDAIRVNLDDSLHKIEQLVRQVGDYMGQGSLNTRDLHVTLAYLKRGKGRDWILSDKPPFGRLTFVELQIQRHLLEALPVMVDEIEFSNSTTDETTRIKIADAISVSTSPESSCGCTGWYDFGFDSDYSW
jgi:hypothetical protein